MEPPTPSPDLLDYFNRARFPPDLEREYRQDYGWKSLQPVRIVAWTAVFIYGFFFYLDTLALPDHYLIDWAIRLPVLLITLGLIWSFKQPWYFRYRLPIQTTWVALINLSILAMVVIADPSEPAFLLYPIGLVYAVMSAYLIFGDLVWAGALNLGTLLTYGLVVLIEQRPTFTPEMSRNVFILVFFIIGFNILGLILGYFIALLAHRDFLLRKVLLQEQTRSENLLLSMLPAPIALRLKRGDQIADHYDDGSVLFSDIVSFTPNSARMAPNEVIELLNRIFSEYDELVERHGLEKIKTNADGYVVVSGVPWPRVDHAEQLAEFALELLAAMEKYHWPDGSPVQVRIGMNCGPLVAGVIGRDRFIYDLFGDTANTGSRMESEGVPGRIQVSQAMYEHLRHTYDFEERGVIPVKGKGDMLVWLMVGRKGEVEG